MALKGEREKILFVVKVTKLLRDRYRKNDLNEERVKQEVAKIFASSWFVSFFIFQGFCQGETLPLSVCCVYYIHQWSHKTLAEVDNRLR